MMHSRIACLARVMMLAAFAGPVFGHSSLQPGALSALTFHQHPGATLPLETRFIDETGRSVRLQRFFHGEPVVLVFEYLRCRDLCSYVIRGAVTALQRVPLVAGRDYEVIALSIDPREGPQDALATRLTDFKGVSSAGWHFLTGRETQIREVAQAVGFSYRYDPAIDQFAHPAGVVVATPTGAIARYVLGVNYRPLDLRLALVEAGQGHISSPVADLLLLCYCYDPGTGRYSFAIRDATRALCGVTVLGLGAMLFGLARSRRA
jgi:protein SCO1/2